MPTRDPDSPEAEASSAGPDPSEPPNTSENPSEFPVPVWTRNEPRVAGATHVGVVRSVNQDAFGRFDDPERGEILLVVADGLGGHRGGEIASQLAVDALGEAVFRGDGDPASRLHDAIEAANARIYEQSQQDLELDGMGTTIVCLLLIEEGRSYVAHVGDSRLYRIRQGQIHTMTEDHSLVATLVREGVLSAEEAKDDPRRNQILRALGVRDEVDIDVAPVELRPGDRYVLCSDGLHGMLEDEEIRFRADRQSPPERLVEHMVEAANQAGGTDNVTCVLAQIPDPMPVDTLRNAAGRLLESTRSVFSRRDGK